MAAISQRCVSAAQTTIVWCGKRTLLPHQATGPLFPRRSANPGRGKAPLRSLPATVTAAVRNTLPTALVVSLTTLLSNLAAPASALELRDEPVLWWDDDTEPIAEPAERDPNIIWDSINDTALLPGDRFFDPVRIARRIGSAFGGDHVAQADDINALGEVVNSTWFTNRIGLFPMNADEVARGPGEGLGPDRTAPWTVVSAKTQGVTPGFNIRDARGDTYLIKFDPRGALGTTTCAGVVSGKLLHAAGYNVPEDVTVRFRREDLTLGENVRIKLQDGSRRSMTEEDLDNILDSVDRLPDGDWFAISSKFLDGRPLGPFDYRGRRNDDPNDRIPHEDRRSLRGLEIFSSWINHFDTKQHNSLDVFVEEAGRSYVRHYLIDFASTLGSGANGAMPRHGYEYTVDLPAIGSRLFSLGLHESVWRTRERPANLAEVGYFDAPSYDPIEFKSLQPNSSFANRTGEDGYWAAKIITAFTNDQLEAVVASAGYRDPEAAAYMTRTLAERRDQIGRTLFSELPALDFFRLEAGRIVFRDLANERGIFPDSAPSYRIRLARVDANGRGDGWTEWSETTTPEVDLRDPGLGRLLESNPTHPFLAVSSQVRRYEEWSGCVTAYFSISSGRTLAVER